VQPVEQGPRHRDDQLRGSGRASRTGSQHELDYVRRGHTAHYDAASAAPRGLERLRVTTSERYSAHRRLYMSTPPEWSHRNATSIGQVSRPETGRSRRSRGRRQCRRRPWRSADQRPAFVPQRPRSRPRSNRARAAPLLRAETLRPCVRSAVSVRADQSDETCRPG
jgi:hypothetical protein